MKILSNYKQRLRAAGLHLLFSLLVSVLAALLVFKVFFPGVYRSISGGQELFMILVAVDVVLGPLLTFAVFNVAKPRRELTTDIALIVSLQIAALLYGLWTVYVARPVYLVHEVDRFQVVTAADIDPVELQEAAPEFRSLPIWGIQTIGVRSAVDEDERLRSLDLALAGKDVAMRPSWWRPLEESHRKIMEAKGKPLSALQGRKNYDEQAVQVLLDQAGIQPEEALAFPVVARRSNWSVLINRRTMSVLGFIPVDGFSMPPRAALGFLPRHKTLALSPPLLHQPHPADGHAAVHSLAHVVDRQQCHAGGGQGFHLHARLAGAFGGGAAQYAA